MINNIMFYLKMFIIFLPFLFFQFLNERANFKREVRYKQVVMPIVALLYFILMFSFINQFYAWMQSFGESINNFLNEYSKYGFVNGIKDFFLGMGGFIALVAICILALSLYILIKRIVLAFCRKNFDEDSIKGSVVGLLYKYDDADKCWYLKKTCAQLRTFVKVAYYAVYTLSVSAMFASYELFYEQLLDAPFCPILVIIVMGELAFLTDGLMKEERKSTMVVQNDNSKHIAMYALLRKPLKKLFGDKLASEGTTINVTGQSGSASEDVLASIEKNGGHIGKNYATFIRCKIDNGLTPNVDYLRSGYDLAIGKSLLFNTPFYDKLIPYAFYAVTRTLLTGKKALIVMGRHGTEDDLIQWCKKGMMEVTNVPDLYKIAVLNGKPTDEDGADIGIISRSGVHDLDIHKANRDFLKQVGFVIIIEPSRLVTTAQIGLNLLIKCCGDDQKITFCSVDRNCDGLVDSLSHILMTNITEVSATEYPHGMSSFMCWKADDDRLQHRLFPGVSRYLGLGTELSFVALKNQVKKTVWYGGDAYPVLDAHWISKQYYYDFLKYANLPTTQECFDQYFKTSFNMCNECVSDYSYVTVEDDRNNLFEARRNFATIAENQGFVNVISPEYMLRDYMADNTEIFTADAKAIPYLTADYARTKRNSVLALCLLLCVGNVSEKELRRKLMLMGVEDDDYEVALWREISVLFSNSNNGKTDKEGNPIIVLTETETGKTVKFDKASILIFKREYSVESGRFENVYTIEDKTFADIILDDLQNAGYIAELEGTDYYIGTELKGHVYQKYLPGQFFTLNGKYYEMLSTTVGNKILVRRASEHINGRISYRQVRKYIFDTVRNSEDMGALKTVNNIDIHYLYADFAVETDGYWKLKSYNDFENGALVAINAVPVRKYYNKQILKLDFSRFGDMFTDSVRKTISVLLNEVFVTLFAENQPFISVVTAGDCDVPSTYSLCVNDSSLSVDNCIFIIEDSQLDIGLLVAVERNIDRIMQIVSDYLIWNNEKIEESLKQEEEQIEEAIQPEQEESENVSKDEPAQPEVEQDSEQKPEQNPHSEEKPSKKDRKKSQKEPVEEKTDEMVAEPTADEKETAESEDKALNVPEKKNAFGAWVKSLFKKKSAPEATEEIPQEDLIKDKPEKENKSKKKKEKPAVEMEKEAEVVGSE